MTRHGPNDPVGRPWEPSAHGAFRALSAAAVHHERGGRTVVLHRHVLPLQGFSVYGRERGEVRMIYIIEYI
jgi:hypothetical protein